MSVPAALSIAYPRETCLGGIRRPSNGEPSGACGGSSSEYVCVAATWCVTCGGVGWLRKTARDPQCYPCPDCDSSTGQREVSTRLRSTVKVVS
jgi:hypothetical protein